MGRLVDLLLANACDPKPGSPLAVDDAGYRWEKLSEWTLGSLKASRDHLLLWANIVTPLEVADDAAVENPARPYFTVARAALESASQAMWVLAPSESAERVARHLRLLSGDLAEQEKALRSSGDVDGAAAASERRASIPGRSGVESVPAPPSFLSMVRAAATDLGQNPDDAEFLWRLCSSATHGKNWFMPQSHIGVVGPEYEPGYFRALWVPSAKEVGDAMGMAATFSVAATTVYLAGLGVDVAASRDSAIERLRELVPKRPPA